MTSLMSFGVAFLARMGRWDQAETLLRTMENGEAKGAFYEAAVSFYRMYGQPSKAYGYAQSWVMETPRSMTARYALLGFLATLKGYAAAAVKAGEWMAAHPYHEDFEEAFCQYAREEFYWRKIRVLRKRVLRNREDGWAWRELPSPRWATMGRQMKSAERGSTQSSKSI